MPGDLPHGGEVHPEQHGHDHRPDQDRDGDVDLGHLHAAERPERPGQHGAERDARHDAEGDPEGEVALEGAQGRPAVLDGGLAVHGRAHAVRPLATR